MLCVLDLGPGVQLADEALNGTQVRCADQVSFVQQDDIRKLHLVHEQVHDRALVSRRGGALLGAVCQLVQAVKVLEEPCGVHDGHHGVQAGHVAQHLPCLQVSKRERLGHWQRLADAGALDDDVVHAAALGEGGHLAQQVFSQRAANAAVLHGHQLLVGLAQHAARPHSGGVHVELRTGAWAAGGAPNSPEGRVSKKPSNSTYLAHVVHNDSHPQAFFVREDVLREGTESCGVSGTRRRMPRTWAARAHLQQGCLATAQEAAEHCHRHFLA